jgi:hypothetical protein
MFITLVDERANYVNRLSLSQLVPRLSVNRTQSFFLLVPSSPTSLSLFQSSRSARQEIRAPSSSLISLSPQLLSAACLKAVQSSSNITWRRMPVAGFGMFTLASEASLDLTSRSLSALRSLAIQPSRKNVSLHSCQCTSLNQLLVSTVSVAVEILSHSRRSVCSFVAL